MVSFKLGKDIEENVVPLVTSVGQRQILSLHEESNLRPSDPRSDALCGPTGSCSFDVFEKFSRSN